MPMNILQPSQQNIDSLLILIFHDMLLWQMTFKEVKKKTLTYANSKITLISEFVYRSNGEIKPRVDGVAFC